jgi:hypothetical protein
MAPHWKDSSGFSDNSNRIPTGSSISHNSRPRDQLHPLMIANPWLLLQSTTPRELWTLMMTLLKSANFEFLLSAVPLTRVDCMASQLQFFQLQITSLRRCQKHNMVQSSETKAMPVTVGGPRQPAMKPLMRPQVTHHRKQ